MTPYAFYTLFLILSLSLCARGQDSDSLTRSDSVLRVGVAGLSHGHVHWVLRRNQDPDLQIVGMVESDTDLMDRLMKQYALEADLLYDNLTALIERTRPDAVLAFGNIKDHLKVVETCAPRGVHVMVEKPLAIDFNQAENIHALAEKHNIQVLVNYETTWYATHHKAYHMVSEQNAIGAIRKIVVHDGHPGPKEIGVSHEFLEWLTDPELNGGGAITDFGCYGANLTTWLKKGQKPTSVTAITQQFKPHIYPEVDDEATILLEYPGSISILQASWNWPFSRKDIEIYGQSGYIIADNSTDLRHRLENDPEENRESLPHLDYPHGDPFQYLGAVIRNEIMVPPYALSSLENNLIVMEILDAARKSAASGEKVFLEQ